jgi:UDP-N-acetylmuramate-alanine ligase
MMLPEASSDVLVDFIPVEGRQEVRLEGKHYAHLHDVAYHPDAVAGLLDAAAQRFPRRQIVVVFQPRITGPRDWPAQRELPGSLSAADAVCVLPAVNPPRATGRPFSVSKLCRDLRAEGPVVRRCNQFDHLPRVLRSLIHRDAVVVSSIQPWRRQSVLPAIDAMIAALEQKAGGGS